MEPYYTVYAAAKAEFVQQKSRFIGHIAPVKNQAAAECFIAQIKEEHRSATHNVSAVIFQGAKAEHCSDDGEPQGTAGLPVLNVLKREKLFDVCVVATRYFGGVLLGAGGLIRAYSHCCKLAVDAAEKIICAPYQKVEINFTYELLGKINYILSNFSLKDVIYRYQERVYLDFFVRVDQAKQLDFCLTEATGGDIKLKTTQVQWK